MSISKRTVLFLRRNGLTYCDPSINSQVSLTFTGAEIKDMEIVNEDLLTRELGSFIAVNTLSPAIVTIVLEKDLLFEQRYVREELEKDKTLNLPNIEKRFTDLTPFENVSSKIIYFGKNIVVLSTNSALFTAIKRILDSHGFIVSSVLPMAVPELEQIKEASVENAKMILSKAESLKADNFMSQDNSSRVYSNESVLEKRTEKIGSNSRAKTSRLPVLIGFFIILILVLAFMIVRMLLG